METIKKFLAKSPLYVRMFLALMILFSIVGSCVRPAEDLRPVSVLVFAVLFWSAGRIVQEGAEALKLLKLVNQFENEQKKGDNDTSNFPPST